jgi:excisionase family DNA binding protein
MTKRNAKCNLPPLLMSIAHAATRLDLGQTTIKKLIREGKLRSVKIRHSRRIIVASFDEYIAELAAVENKMRRIANGENAIRKLERRM